MKLIDVAIELNRDNPTIPTQAFINLLLTSRLWIFEWGVILAVDNEVHIHILKPHQKRVFLRPAIRQVASELFKQYGIVTTKIAKNKLQALKFDLNIGFKLTNETATEWHLSITKGSFKYGKS